MGRVESAAVSTLWTALARPGRILTKETAVVQVSRKAVPNKNAGFIILLTSITFFFIFGEIRNLTALCLLNNNGFSLSSFFLCSLSFLWIGAQFPQEKFLSYARILTLYY